MSWRALSVVLLLAGCATPRTPEPVVVVAPTSAPPEPPVAPRSAAPKRRPPTVIPWTRSDTEGFAAAKKRGIPVVVFAAADWSTASREMDRAVWSDPELARFVPSFVWIRLDLTSTEGDSEAYAEKYGIARVPTMLLFDPGGRKTGELSGLVEIEKLVFTLSRAAE